MARIRSVKPEFWSSPDTAACKDPWARLLFIAMWNWADDAGRGTANPKELAGFAFPNDEEITSADIRRMLGEVRRAFGVILYIVDGRPYYAIPSWDKHQKIDKRSGARHPPPEDGQGWDPDPSHGPDQGKRGDSAALVEPSADSTEPPPTPRRTPGVGTGEQGNRGTGSSEAPDGASGASAPRETITAQDVVRAWVDACRANGVEPSKAQIGQVARTAKELLGKNQPDRVLAAAQQAGQRGYVNIDRELTAMAAKPHLRPVPVAPDRAALPPDDPRRYREWDIR